MLMLALKKSYRAVKGFHVYSMGKLRRLYEWILSWSDSKYATWALFLLAFTESSFFPIPPDVLLIALILGKPKRFLYYVGVATAGSVLGAFLGYYIGVALYESIGVRIIDFFHYQSEFEQVGVFYDKNAFLFILASAFTPIPYKVFTIAAGVWNINLITLTTASIIGRGARFLLVGFLLYKYGSKIKPFIDKYFNLLTLIFLVLLIGGFVLIKYIM